MLYYYGNYIKEDKMSMTYKMHGTDEICIKNFSQKTRREELTCKSWQEWENSIQMDFKDMGCEGVDWIQPDYDKVKCQDPVNIVTDIQAP